ncbi:BMC domain-containing protein [Providencia rettgeri]|nr:BMC domain-containing protein [Providencia rettgeri]
MKSLGVIETKGLTSAIKAADAACKATSVEIVGYRKIGSGLVSVCFQGEISAVRTAVDHGIEVLSQSQLLIGSLVIARPESSVINKLLSVKSKKGGLLKSTNKPEVIQPTDTKHVQTPLSTPVALEESVQTSEEVKTVKSDLRKGKKS